MAGPDWLRNEISYRTYVRGIRWAVIWGCGIPLAALLDYLHAIGSGATKVMAFSFAFAAGASVLIGAVCWLLVPDKNRAANQRGMPLMILRDVVLGIPRTQPPDLDSGIKGWQPKR